MSNRDIWAISHNLAMRSFPYLLVLLLLSFEPIAFCQYGIAPNGYYPPHYDGNIFSGRVTAVDEASGNITISFEKDKKVETFVGHLQQGCAVPSKDGTPMTALDLPIGTDITAYFETVSKDGNPVEKENLIIGIMFHSWNGHPVRQQSKKMYLCSRAPVSGYWRCFGSAGATCLEPPH